MNNQELFQFESVQAVCNSKINGGAPMPCLRTGKITDPQLKAWFVQNFTSVGEYLRLQEIILSEGGVVA